MRGSSRDRMMLGAMVAAFAGAGVVSGGTVQSGYANVPEIPAKQSVPGASHRRKRIRKGFQLFNGGRHKPHQGAREKARRRKRGETTNTVAHAHRWAGWKSGRSVHVIDGVPFCYPAESETVES